MNNIEQYRKRFYNLMESTMGDVKPIISEQPTTEPVKSTNSTPEPATPQTTDTTEPQLPKDMTGRVNFYYNESQGGDSAFSYNINAITKIDKDFLYEQGMVTFSDNDGNTFEYECTTNRFFVKRMGTMSNPVNLRRIYNKEYQNDLKRTFCGKNQKGDMVPPTTNPKYAQVKSSSDELPKA